MNYFLKQEGLRMKRNQWKKVGSIIGFLAVAALALSGCSGSDGSTGATGPAGPAGPPGEAVTTFNAQNVDYLSKATWTGTITSVSIASPLVVEFTIVDGKGNGVEGLEIPVGTSTSLNNLRFTVAKLVPGTNKSPDMWFSYLIGATFAAQNHEKVAANLTALGNGKYRYTFKTDLTKVDGVTYEPTLTHRVGIRFSGAITGTTTQMKNSIAFVKDFIPAGGTIVTQREITTKADCLECHGTFEGRSGGHLAYADPKMCVLCHTDQWRKGATESTITGTVITPPAGTKDTNIVRGEALLNFINMIHKAHMGTNLTLTGYAHNNGGWLPNDMVYPQDIINCRKCHTASAATPQGENWKNKPSRQACGSCHDGIDWTTGSGTTVKGATTGHDGGPAANDALCAGCHAAISIDAVYHVTANATPNNPNVPAGAVNFIYEINTVMVNESLQPVVKFRIKSYTGTDATTATPVTFNNAAAATLLTGFTGSPSFLVTYALPQDGITAPVDYNNLGKASAQPASVSIDNVRKGTAGTMAGPDGSGYYTATLTGTAAFPAGAKLRAVALQGYFSQVSPALARHTPGVIKNVTGDTVRRTVVDSAKCANCHEWFEGHGGNRVYEIQMCLPCHVPNLSSSGRTIRTTDPEASQNLKDMVHSIHAAEMRTNPYKGSRAKSGAATVWDFSGVVYPGLLQTCEACHKPGTYASVPAGAFMTANVTTGDASATIDPATSVVTSTDTTASLTTLRNAGLANATDLVITPFTAACVSCHDGASAKAHMTANGGAINESRSTVNAAVEQCAICHGPGRSQDAAAVHANFQAGH
jgi:OmcA/MtrC family decaheme c-type cytochrome